MKDKTFSFILINSFDRSGSSFTAKLLAKHPKIECLFQPFNGSIFRREMYKVWDKDFESLDGKELFDAVLNGNFNDGTIKSHWFFKHSTCTNLSKDKLHLIKTTNLHFKIKWILNNYPNVETWALIRNPLGILASLVRNGQHEAWYGGSTFNEILNVYKQLDFYDEKIYHKMMETSDSVEQMAYIISILNTKMLKDTPEKHVLKYENLLENANTEFSKLLVGENIPGFDFSLFVGEDFNIIGKKFEGFNKHIKSFPKEKLKKYTEIFQYFDGVGYSL